MALIVSVELPGAPPGFGLKLALTLVGRPETLSVTEPGPPPRLTVSELLDFFFTFSEDAESPSVKSAAAGLMVSETEVV